MATCIAQAARQKALSDCKANPIANVSACVRARMRLCPPPDVQPSIEQGKDGISLLGVYQLCRPPPTELAPYPPSRPLPSEAAAQVTLQRQSAQSVKQSGEMLKLESRARRARELELTPAFWVGLGLVGLGAAALYLKR